MAAVTERGEVTTRIAHLKAQSPLERYGYLFMRLSGVALIVLAILLPVTLTSAAFIRNIAELPSGRLGARQESRMTLSRMTAPSVEAT